MHLRNIKIKYFSPEGATKADDFLYTSILTPPRWEPHNNAAILTPTSVDSKSSFVIVISRVWGVAGLDEIHMNVQCAIVLHVLYIKHHKADSYSCAHALNIMYTNQKSYHKCLIFY